MANFRKLTNKRPSLERAIELSDQEVDAEDADARPSRGNFGQMGPAATVMENAEQERYKKRVELKKRLRRKEVAKSYGQNL